MMTPKLWESQMQLQEILDFGFRHPRISPWRALVIFINNKDGS
jgi:hypothetical protein